MKQIVIRILLAVFVLAAIAYNIYRVMPEATVHYEYSPLEQAITFQVAVPLEIADISTEEGGILAPIEGSYWRYTVSGEGSDRAVITYKTLFGGQEQSVIELNCFPEEQRLAISVYNKKGDLVRTDQNMFIAFATE
jgi:hypothetical protein